jgi:ABC-type lipoprotein export system ATPase subunit
VVVATHDREIVERAAQTIRLRDGALVPG